MRCITAALFLSFTNTKPFHEIIKARKPLLLMIIGHRAHVHPSLHRAVSVTRGRLADAFIHHAIICMSFACHLHIFDAIPAACRGLDRF